MVSISHVINFVQFVIEYSFRTAQRVAYFRVLAEICSSHDYNNSLGSKRGLRLAPAGETPLAVVRLPLVNKALAFHAVVGEENWRQKVLN